MDKAKLRKQVNKISSIADVENPSKMLNRYILTLEEIINRLEALQLEFQDDLDEWEH